MPTFFSLFSFLFTMTVVICWSMKIRMQASKAGRRASGTVQSGLPSNGGISQPRPSHVGWNRAWTHYFSPSLLKVPCKGNRCELTRNELGTFNLGVLMPIAISTPVMITMAIMTAKSLNIWRTRDGK